MKEREEKESGKMMNSQRDRDQEENLQRDILSDRKYSLAEAIGREGGNFLKGESPVPKLVQVTTEVNLFIDQNLSDSSGALQSVLKRWVKTDPLLSQHLESPLKGLDQILEKILTQKGLFYEMVREADVKWGQMYQERPYFQKPGDPPHPEDEYTHESVREKLSLLREKITS